METNTEKKTKSGLLNRPEPVSKMPLPQIDFALRRANRALLTESLVALMKDEAQPFFESAEVVGRWVWIKFDDKQPQAVTRSLAELGFHWNKKRQTWQHPCGEFPRYGVPLSREVQGSKCDQCDRKCDQISNGELEQILAAFT